MVFHLCELELQIPEPSPAWVSRPSNGQSPGSMEGGTEKLQLEKIKSLIYLFYHLLNNNNEIKSFGRKGMNEEAGSHKARVWQAIPLLSRPSAGLL